MCENLYLIYINKFSNAKAKKIKNFYCNELPVLKDSDLETLINIKKTFLLYKNILEEENINLFREVFSYLCN